MSTVSARATRLADSFNYNHINLEILEWQYPSHRWIGREATILEDMTLAVDLVIGDDDLAKGTGIAVKKRDRKYLAGRDFGLRSKADHKQSEWEKVLSGKADQLLYTFQGEDGHIIWWYLIDLCVLRRAARNKWFGCTYPTKTELPDHDIYLTVVKLDGINERMYGRLLINEGPFPLPQREETLIPM